MASLASRGRSNAYALATSATAAATELSPSQTDVQNMPSLNPIPSGPPDSRISKSQFRQNRSNARSKGSGSGRVQARILTQFVILKNKWPYPIKGGEEPQLQAAADIAKEFEALNQIWSDKPITLSDAQQYLERNKDAVAVTIADKKKKFLASDADDEVIDDIDFDAACRGALAENLKFAFQKSFPSFRNEGEESPGDVLYNNMILTLTNLFFSLKEAELQFSLYNVNVVTDKVKAFEKDLGAGMTADKLRKFLKELADIGPNYVRYALYNDEWATKAIKDHIKEKHEQKNAEGELEMCKFIYSSGLYEKQEDREKAKEQLRVMMEVSENMFSKADKLLTQIAKDNEGYGKMGPPKNVLGTFKKATRKILGREKDTSWETLNQVKDPVLAGRLCISIKDIIRGTLIFSSYEKMTKAYLRIANKLRCKKIKDVKKYGDLDVDLLGITKATTGFVPAEHATYRDMKLVVILRLEAKDKKTIEDAKIEYFPGVAFEIQFNTARGAIVKSGTVETEEDSNDPMPLSQNEVGKVLKTVGLEGKELKTSYLDKGEFEAQEFLKDCEQDATGTIKEQVKALRTKHKDDPTIKKAHAVYKMAAGAEKTRLESIYEDVYRCAYMVDGFDENSEKTLKQEIKEYVLADLSKWGPI